MSECMIGFCRRPVYKLHLCREHDRYYRKYCADCGRYLTDNALAKGRGEFCGRCRSKIWGREQCT